MTPDPTPLDRLDALLEASKRPNHGEETWERKQAWDRANEADSELERLSRNHLRALIDAARALDMLWTHYLLPITDEQKQQIREPLALLSPTDEKGQT